MIVMRSHFLIVWSSPCLNSLFILVVLGEVRYTHRAVTAYYEVLLCAMSVRGAGCLGFSV